MNRQKRLVSAALVSVCTSLGGCIGSPDGASDLKGLFYPLDLALVCDQTTPKLLRSMYPEAASGYASPTACVERDSGVTALAVSTLDIARNPAFSEPVYEVQIHIAGPDQPRMISFMAKAQRTRRDAAFLVHGMLVGRALVMGPPQNGTIVMGGYSSEQEAAGLAAHFKVSSPSQVSN